MAGGGGGDDAAALYPVAGVGDEVVWVVLAELVRARLRRQREDERDGALAARHRAAQTLRLEVAELLHEVAGLHQRHVREVEVAQNLVLESEIMLPHDLSTGHLGPTFWPASGWAR